MLFRWCLHVSLCVWTEWGSPQEFGINLKKKKKSTNSQKPNLYTNPDMKGQVLLVCFPQVHSQSLPKFL